MKQDEWTIRSMLEWTQNYLTQKGDEHPRLSAEWLINAATGLSRVEIYTNIDRPFSAEELSLMHDAVLRRGRGEPLQYVTGEMPFRHIVLRCEEGVLIPRPETEVLVDVALSGIDAATEAGHSAEVLEIGVGSGCISCSLATERPGTHVVASDLSPVAVSLAQKNCEALGVAAAVDIVQGDLIEGIDQTLLGTFDVLVSNPPYIPTSDLAVLPQEVVGFEPNLALDGGADGLDVFRRILELAPQVLRPGGMLCCELYETNVHTAANLCTQQGGWSFVEVQEDLTHRPRVLVAIKEGDLKEGGALTTVVRKLTAEVDRPSRNVIREAARALMSDAVVIMPTDSVYGIGCAAYPNNSALEKIFTLKERSLEQTLPWLVSGIEDVHTYAQDVPEWAFSLIEAFWPGALTLVFYASDLVPQAYCNQAANTIALRCPNTRLVRDLVRQIGVPLATTSANLHAMPAATSVSELDQRLLLGADLVIDGGPSPLGRASTIVDCTHEAPHILRVGAIPEAEIMRVALH